MIDEKLLADFHAQFDRLSGVVNESNKRIISEPPDDLFYEYQNVFIKSYLVSACSTLEAFIQDLAYAYLKIICDRIALINLPYNAVAWATTKENDSKGLKFEAFILAKGKKDLSDMISANYHKTLKAFERIGVRLAESPVENYKDFISSTVEKRNKIVHHNDDASDLSFSDILDIIQQFKEYSEELFRLVSDNPHIST